MKNIKFERSMKRWRIFSNVMFFVWVGSWFAGIWFYDYDFQLFLTGVFAFFLALLTSWGIDLCRKKEEEK